MNHNSFNTQAEVKKDGNESGLKKHKSVSKLVMPNYKKMFKMQDEANEVDRTSIVLSPS